MDVAVRLAVPVGLCRWRDSPSCYSPLVKITYDLRSSGWAALSSEQEPITDGEISGNLVLWPSDFGEAKGACEIAIVGAALHTHDKPIRVRVGSTTLEADRARKLGPIGRGGGRSYFAVDAARITFPSLPLEVVIEGVGETVRCAIPVPAPDIALVMGRAWGEAQRIRPFIDEVLLDPVRRRCTLVFRGFFTYPGDLDAAASLVVDALGRLDGTNPREIGRWPRMSAVTLDDFAVESTTAAPYLESARDDAPTPDSDSRPSIPLPGDDDGETTGEHMRPEATVDASLEATSQLARSPLADIIAAATADVLEIDPNEAAELLDDESTSDPPVEEPSTTDAPRRSFDRTIPMPMRRPTPPIGVPFARAAAHSARSATTRMPVFGPPPTAAPQQAPDPQAVSIQRKPARTQQMTSADLAAPPALAPPRFGPAPGARPPPPAPPPPTEPGLRGPAPAPTPNVRPGAGAIPPPPPSAPERPRRFKDENESTQLFVLPIKPATELSSGLPFAKASPSEARAAPRFVEEPRAPQFDPSAARGGPSTTPPPEDAGATIPPPPETPSERRTAPPPMPSQSGWAEPPYVERTKGPSTAPPPGERSPSTEPPPPPVAPIPPKRRMFDVEEHTAQIQLPVAPRALPFVEGPRGDAAGEARATLGASGLRLGASSESSRPTPPAFPALAPRFPARDRDAEAMRSDETVAADEDRATALPDDHSPRRGTDPPPPFAVTPGAPDWLAQKGSPALAPPPVATRLADLAAPPPVEASTIPATPQWKPRAVKAPESAPLVSDATPSITLEEYAALRAELWSGERSRRDVLKSKGLSELRWRAIERKFAREIDSMSNDPSRLLPLLSRLEAR